MKHFLLLFVLICLFSGVIQPGNIQLYKNIGNLPLEGGGVLINCRVGYRTAGLINHDSSNVLVYVTWFGGNSSNLYSLLGPDKLIDTNNYFIIMIDALGNGISTSPSNYASYNDQPFPAITIYDMVKSQYILLRDSLGFKAVLGFIGGSMGSMQVLQWAVQYPGYAKKHVAYVPTPKSSVYDLLYWNIQLNTIKTGMKYNIPAREYMKGVNLVTNLNARTPEYLVRNVTSGLLDTIIMKSERDPDTIFTPENYLEQLSAMMHHNIYKYADEAVIHKTARERVFLIISKYDHILNPEPALTLSKNSGCKTKIFESDCGHLVIGCNMEESRKLIADYFAGRE